MLKLLGHVAVDRPRQATMTSTNMFQGLETSGKPSSRYGVCALTVYLEQTSVYCEFVVDTYICLSESLIMIL